MEWRNKIWWRYERWFVNFYFKLKFFNRIHGYGIEYSADGEIAFDGEWRDG